MKYGLIGEKLPHSFSKIIHEKIGDYSYELVELQSEELSEFMNKRSFDAINVTIPYKQAVIPYLYEMSDTAREIGAVNTIVNRNGKLYGYNTDYYGMLALIRKNNVDLSGKKVAVLGTGGTSKTAFSVAKNLGAEVVYKVSRREDVGTITYFQLYEDHNDVDVIINTTPVGMYPNIFSSPLDISGFQNLTAVFDAIYNPIETMFVSAAKRNGIMAEGGLYMLVAQAIKAYEIFMDKQTDDKLLENIYNEILTSKQNIVLTGMPGSGKTTIGKEVAEKLNRVFIDTDDEIKKVIKTEISDFFEMHGEEKFREVEAEVISRIAEKSGCVIATGGGAVLKTENVNALKMNGIIYFLDRPIQDIIPTSDRPTASNVSAIKKRYSERYEIYNSTCDKVINVTGVVSDAVAQIESEHFQNEYSCN